MTESNEEKKCILCDEKDFTILANHHPLTKICDRLGREYGENPSEKKSSSLMDFLHTCCDKCTTKVFYCLICDVDYWTSNAEHYSRIFSDLFLLQKKSAKREVEKALVKVGFVSAIESGYAAQTD